MQTVESGALYDVVRVDDVSQRFGHLTSLGVTDETVEEHFLAKETQFEEVQTTRNV